MMKVRIAGEKTRLSLRLIILSAWIVSSYLASTSYVGQVPAFLYGAMFIALPAVVLNSSALKYLIGRPIDVASAIVVAFAVGQLGVHLWNRGDISDLQMFLVWLPMYQLCLLAAAYYLFLRLMNREPVNVLFDMGVGKWPDRALFMSIIVLLVLVPGSFLAQVK